MTEARRHHADNGVSISVEIHAAAQHVGIASEKPAPCGIADHAGIAKTKRLVFRAEDSPKLRRHTKNREICRAGAEQLDALGAISSGKVRAHGPAGGNLVENAGAIAEVIKFQ